jgi:uncharacterized protein (DUF1800 family)
VTRAARTRAEIERLLWRAGFGPRQRDLARLAPGGRAAAVEALLAPPRGPELEPAPQPNVDGHALDPRNTWGHDVLWWLDRCVRARHPLVERMTLVWHDHFATSNGKVGDVGLMMAQYRTMRRHALGRFRDLAHAMLADGAMQLWLDLDNSHKREPNENFARELLELFTLGVNQGYTEQDVREASRALTGFTFDWDTKSFGYDADRHDGGVKTILGRQGRFAPHDVVDLAVDHPAHAPYICGKLWRAFTPRPCPPATLAEMRRVYVASGTELRPVLRVILGHPLVYADLEEPDMVKPPLVYLAGMLRQTGRGVRSGDWRWRLHQMGQAPFYPPSVAGWDPDGWLTTGTIKARFDAASALMRDAIEDGSVPASQTPSEAVAAALRATGRPWASRRTMAALTRYATSSVAGRTRDWEVRHFFPERQRVLRHMLLAGPDAQVC